MFNFDGIGGNIITLCLCVSALDQIKLLKKLNEHVVGKFLDFGNSDCIKQYKFSIGT